MLELFYALLIFFLTLALLETNEVALQTSQRSCAGSHSLKWSRLEGMGWILYHMEFICYLHRLQSESSPVRPVPFSHHKWSLKECHESNYGLLKFPLVGQCYMKKGAQLFITPRALAAFRNVDAWIFSLQAFQKNSRAPWKKHV